ncbi:MAG TPA: YceI family protein [Candidatus Paceibacterota bacterium]|nr:YceI family protein [Candidatus Paceibacterota bacterium]HMP18742.1 YceI family protein [Candidatus Paceibacterota bacterium]HMP85251.1 YceI family protein [Candidatus Paceibacterota bacterium]
MKKTLIIVIILIVVLVLLFVVFGVKSPSQDLPTVMTNGIQQTENDSELIENSDSQLSKILNNLDLTIIGFGPGKSHPGTFTNYAVSDIKLSEDQIIQKAKVVIKSESRDFKIDGLNRHLCAEEFLNCATYPEIVFDLSSVIKESENRYIATGELTFRGITKSISFPVEKEGEKYMTNVRFDISQFGIKYVGVNDEIEIKISTK